ncbi:unnamed protein product [Arabidopsis halleri]
MSSPPSAEGFRFQSVVALSSSPPLTVMFVSIRLLLPPKTPPLPHLPQPPDPSKSTMTKIWESLLVSPLLSLTRTFWPPSHDLLPPSSTSSLLEIVDLRFPVAPPLTLSCWAWPIIYSSWCCHKIIIFVGLFSL